MYLLSNWMPHVISEILHMTGANLPAKICTYSEKMENIIMYAPSFEMFFMLEIMGTSECLSFERELAIRFSEHLLYITYLTNKLLIKIVK